MKRSIDQLKYIDRTSRHTRHHQLCLNQICNQKLSRDLNTLTNEYVQTFKHAKQQFKLEQQRKQVLDMTVQQIEYRREHPLLPTKTNPILPKIDVKTNRNTGAALLENLQNRPSSSSIKLVPIKTPCHRFSQKCQLYPCQPLYHYTSFVTRDHDQILRQRDSSIENPDFPPDPNYLQDLITKTEEERSHQNRRQVTVAMHNQHHLANRHVFIKSTKARLDEQSRLLHERLNDKRTFGYNKERQTEISQAIKRHLKISAKFCG